MPSLNLPIALGVVGRGSHMVHSTDPDELFEVTGNELRTVIRDDPGPFRGVLFFSPLEDDFHLWLSHGLPDLPVHNVAAISIQHTAQVIKGASDMRYDTSICQCS
jgi:hypothetical protein